MISLLKNICKKKDHIQIDLKNNNTVEGTLVDIDDSFNLLIKNGVVNIKIDQNENTICYVTGNGLKATESLMEVLPKPEVMQADISKISAVVR